MPSKNDDVFDERLDLRLERVVDVPPRLVWMAWTEPKHLMPWFCPKPWQVTDCRIDLRPGGVFYTLMRGPGGEEHGGEGCYLEVVPEKRLVWTSHMGPGFRPLAGEPMPFTGIMELSPEGSGTRYRATVLHADEEGRKQHAEMGFEQGWGTALEQLVAYVKGLGLG